MKTSYVICYLQQNVNHGGEVVALNEFRINDWVDDKLNILMNPGERKIPDFSTPDEAILWYDEFRVKVKLAVNNFNSSQHGFFASTVDYDLDDEIYIVQKVKF